MRPRFLADADLSVPIIRGLRRVHAGIDFLSAQTHVPHGLPDSEVLELAANLGRVLVSHDFETMPGHFYRFVRRRESPGLVLIDQRTAIGIAIEELRCVWARMDVEEFKNRIVYLP